MKLLKPLRSDELAELIGAKLVGAGDVEATGINEIHVVEDGDIVFVDHPKYYEPTLNSKASVVIIDQEVDAPSGKTLLVHPSPFDAFNQLTQAFIKERESASDSNPSIDPSAIIMDGASIGRYVQIGKGTVVHPGAVIYDHCVIGDHVTIHANTVIGSDAFYFKRASTHHEKLRSVGRVIIEDEVEIGSASTIDRGVTGDTIVGKGSKLDNQVHIGHDTKIGQRCLFAAQVGIAGCVVIGNDVTMWGQVGCAANVTIGDKVVVLAQSGIGKSLDAGVTYFGSPAKEARTAMREIATLSQLSKKK